LNQNRKILVMPGAVQREAVHRAPGTQHFTPLVFLWIPDQQRITSCCAASGMTRVTTRTGHPWAKSGRDDQAKGMN
jgi:hypothetical protein